MRKLLTILISTFFLQGCVIGHQKFYSQVAPSKYPPTREVMHFEYENISLDDFYKTFFSDFLVIGRSGFMGPYEDPKLSIEYAKSIGADLFISTSQFKETRTSYSTITTPTTNTTYLSGMVGSSFVSGTATSYGTHTTTVPIQTQRYDQNGLYLRNVNKVTPLWERTVRDYPVTEQTTLGGEWSNDSYKILIYKSNQFIVATVQSIDNDPSRSRWRKDDVKFVYDAATGVGIYMMGSKAPMPADFTVNKFGHLEVSISPSKTTFSFERR
jgi:hypothetical protein